MVSDPETQKSSVVLTVKSGSLNDPREFQGLSHFLEHMLFLGSQKFPKSGYYREKIIENGGSTNAHTELDRTVYHHTIKNEAFEESLDIFS